MNTAAAATFARYCQMSDLSASNDFVIIRCTSCLAKNRVPAARVLTGPKCGVCKQTIDVPTKPVWLRADSYDRAVAYWPETLLVVFVAQMCVHCKIIEPLLQELARDRAGRLKVAKVDTEIDTSLVQRFKVERTPTFVVYKDGVEIIRVDGPPKEKEELRKWIDNITGYTSY